MEALIFRSFSSGSNGNCYYFGTRTCGVLVDAGISSLQIRRGLREIGVEPKNVYGVLTTHDHADHVRGLGGVTKRMQLPIYATAKTFAGIDGNWAVKEKPEQIYRHIIEKDTTFSLAGLQVTPFAVSHDSQDCVGYFLCYGDVAITLATDVGKTDDVLAYYVRQSTYAIIEANYDEQMLLSGSYPAVLKKRVLSDVGHMSNESCGQFLAKSISHKMKHIFLCHISQNNNTPELAYNTVARHLNQAGFSTGQQPKLFVLPRVTPSPVFELTL